MMCLMTTPVVQVREGLGKTANATALSVEAGLGQDSHGNTIVPIAASAGLKLHRSERGRRRLESQETRTCTKELKWA